jgi:predicted lipid carrier protein YhbT
MMSNRSRPSLTLSLPPVPERLRVLVSRLPVRPPSMLAALALNRVWWPLLNESARRGLMGRVVELQVDDLGLSCRLVAGPAGLRAAPSTQEPAVRLRAAAATYWRLLNGQDDPDTLFFERALVMEGDTEFGLFLKNTLDAVGPIDLWGRRGAKR